jgi:hypothetical protein
MKTSFLKAGLLIMIVGLLMTTSCLKDSNNLTQYWLSYGVVIGSTGSYNVRLDDGTILYPDAGSQSLVAQYATNRVLVNYTIVSSKIENSVTNYNVKVSSIDKLLLKNVVTLTKQNADSLGNDPINAYNFWFGNNYLNINFSFLQNSKIHLINLAKDTIQSDPTTVSLLLRHNALGDSPTNDQSGFVSFDLTSLLNGKDSINVDVKFKDYYGNSRDFKGTFKPLQ